MACPLLHSGPLASLERTALSPADRQPPSLCICDRSVRASAGKTAQAREMNTHVCTLTNRHLLSAFFAAFSPPKRPPAPRPRVNFRRAIRAQLRPRALGWRYDGDELHPRTPDCIMRLTSLLPHHDAKNYDAQRVQAGVSIIAITLPPRYCRSIALLGRNSATSS